MKPRLRLRAIRTGRTPTGRAHITLWTHAEAIRVATRAAENAAWNDHTRNTPIPAFLTMTKEPA